MKFQITLLLLVLITQIAHAQEASKIVFEDSNGCLRYVSDEEGNYIPDFSYAGFRNGEVPLPNLAVVDSIGPIAGDNTAHLQEAIDATGAWPLMANGMRGALLLLPGRYEIHSTIKIQHQGVVLRGSGSETDVDSNSVLIGVGNVPEERDLVQVGNQGNTFWTGRKTGSQSNIINEYIPVGSRSIQVAQPELYSMGDQVIIFQPSTDAWLASINYGDTDSDDPWEPGQIDVVFNRYIAAVNLEESKIILNSPIYDHLDRSLSQSYMYILDEPNIVKNIGIENIRITIETASSTDENHARNAIRLIGVEDCWVKDVVAEHFSYAAVDMTTATRVTVSNCQGLDPHSIIDGGRRYNFAVNHRGNHILFENCHASLGRHSFVSNGISSASGLVFHNCTSTGDFSSSEGHRRWSQALLFDNVTFSQSSTNTLLGLYNRGRYGTGHGWSSVHSVAWKVKVPETRNIKLQKPPHRQNYAIGCDAIVTNAHQFAHPAGYSELTRSELLIPSLYERQLQQRLSQGVAPDVPASLTAMRQDGGVQLNWLDVAGDEDSYHVEYSMDEGLTYETIEILPPNALEYFHEVDFHVIADKIIYRIFTGKQNCFSPYSNPASIDISTSSSQWSAVDVLIYPNPFHQEIRIRSEEKIRSVSIFNLQGQEIYSGRYSPNINTSDWLPGIYLVSVEMLSGGNLIFRLVR